MKKKQIAFCVADENNLKYAKMMENSLRKFHSEEELPLVIIGPKELAEIERQDKFYLMTPLIARRLIKDYDLVIKLDADQIIVGDLNYILDNKDYDVGCVLNFSRSDFKEFGPITVWDIPPTDYMNCGFVAMRNEEFIEHWWKLCNGPHFNTYQYREQDLMNILYHYGNYKTKCFDYYDEVTGYSSWHGLLSRGEWPKVKLVGDKLMLEKTADEYPNRDIQLRCIHWAGGNTPNKLNYRLFFNDEVCKRLDYLVGDKK